ncbi:MAG: trypsin-like serine protease, partial [Pseudomonadota bacterium]
MTTSRGISTTPGAGATPAPARKPSSCAAPERAAPRGTPGRALRRLARTAGLIAALSALAAPAPAQSPAPGPTAPEILPLTEQPAWNAIGRVNIAGYKSRRMCSGTLIAPDLVLTAAHCVLGPTGDPAPAGDIVFVAGWRAGEAAADARGAALDIAPGFLSGA